MPSGGRVTCCSPRPVRVDGEHRAVRLRGVEVAPERDPPGGQAAVGAAAALAVSAVVAPPQPAASSAAPSAAMGMRCDGFMAGDATSGPPRSPVRSLVRSEGLPSFPRRRAGVGLAHAPGPSRRRPPGSRWRRAAGTTRRAARPRRRRDDPDRAARRRADAARRRTPPRSSGSRHVRTRVSSAPGGASNERDPEGATVADVRSGRLPFAVISARAFDVLGVDAFAPLLAPMAIDSLETERRVLAAGLARAGAARARQARRRRRRGAPRGAAPSARPHAAAPAPGGLPRRVDRRAPLGARAARVRAARRDTATDRRRTTPASTASRPTSPASRRPADVGATSLAADVSLWPRLLVLVANPKAWERARPAAPESAARGGAARRWRPRSHDSRPTTRSYGVLCRRGAVVVRARDGRSTPRRCGPRSRPPRAGSTPARQGDRARAGSGRAAARASAVPPRGAREAGAVRRRSTARGSSRATSSTSRAPRGPTPSPRPRTGATTCSRSRRGRFAITQEAPGACTWAYGTFSVRGHRMTWDVIDGGGFGPQDATNRPGEHFDYSWSRFKDTLELGPIRGKISPTNFSALAWHRIGANARAAPLSRRCPPPAGAISSEVSAGTPARPGRAGAGRASRAARAS